MDRIWAPWRAAYIAEGGTGPAKGVPEALSAWLDSPSASDQATQSRHCVFCNIIAAVDYAVARGMPPAQADREALIIIRDARTFLCLNRYPYSTGHVLIIPYQHADSLAKLPAETAQEIIFTAQRVETALRGIYHPGGLNFGLNLGEAAGAGIAAHLHMHALPRWTGDSNFMTVTAATRILPETLETTWEKLRQAFI